MKADVDSASLVCPMALASSTASRRAAISCSSSTTDAHQTLSKWNECWSSYGENGGGDKVEEMLRPRAGVTMVGIAGYVDV